MTGALYATRKKRFFGSSPLILSASFLALFGILMQYCASSYNAQIQTGDEFFFVKKQALAAVAAFACMFVLSRTDIKKLAKFAPAALVIAIAALAAVFIPGLGVERYGATRWLNLGIATVQPSEFAKFALVLFISAVAARDRKLRAGSFALIAFAAGSVCLLIMLEPNMSITVLVALVTVFMLFAIGVKLRWFALLAVPAAAALVVLIALEPYRIKRLLAFLDPWSSPLAEGYQLIQSYYALGSGGWFGVGLFNSRQKYLFLPFAESDILRAHSVGIQDRGESGQPFRGVFRGGDHGGHSVADSSQYRRSHGQYPAYGTADAVSEFGRKFAPDVHERGRRSGRYSQVTIGGSRP